MKKLLKTTVLLTAGWSLLLVAGCGDREKEKHRITENGTEWGVPIDVMLTGGGTARLICPKFKGSPRGAHGRECYLDSYSYDN